MSHFIPPTAGGTVAQRITSQDPVAHLTRGKCGYNNGFTEGPHDRDQGERYIHTSSR